MRWRNILSLSFNALSQRKMRTGLTTLGIIVGILTIVAISSLSGGFENQISNMVTSDFQADVVTVTSGGFLGGSSIHFEQQDIQNISKLDHVNIATGMQQNQVIMFHDGRNITAVLYGVNFTEFFEVYTSKLTFANGSLPTPINNNTLILGYNDNPIAEIGQNITLQFFISGFIGNKNATFELTGIFDKIGFAGTTVIDHAAFIPLETLQSFYEKFGIVTYMSTILVKVDDPNNADQVGNQIKSYFNDQANVIVASSLIGSLRSILNIVTVFLLAIGSIALLVAGISIMNIMLVSVMERTREIGVLKALGAKNRTVLTQFLTEASLIGLLGGLIGIPLGLGLAYLLGKLLPSLFSSSSFGGFGGGEFGGMGQALVINPVIDPTSIIFAMVFALAITVIFALYPARKASKLDPVTALRYE